MTDLEREASEIVRDILDACASAAGFRDYLDATSSGLDRSPPPWRSVDQSAFKQRILALAKPEPVDVRGIVHTAWQRAAMDLP